MRPTPNPINGPRFKAARALDVKLAPAERKLLCLLAAYSDAGEDKPPVRELARRLNVSIEAIDTGLQSLSRRKLIWIDWSLYHRLGDQCPEHLIRRRNRYTLTCLGDPLPAHAVRRIERARLRGCGEPRKPLTRQSDRRPLEGLTTRR